ncbi:4Fe-4S binding protein [Vibrio sp. JC009]|uniref:4Fe-4S binding protein n=1 Tax=Vibrio sp. JC009 TaxID=2912314 RepID=UPI0023B0F69E|nr:4Fe-4S binding protein [Vibrio sp. JC009]WED24089.1 4Fe-4S binding protein [Vibrio sp. JC009]
MKYAITDKCTGCHACQTVCPNNAVYKNPEAEKFFLIHEKRCNGCEGIYDEPQCASICPIEEAIVFETGLPVNPKGSLTGIPAQSPGSYTQV